MDGTDAPPGAIRLTRQGPVALIEMMEPRSRNALSDGIKDGLAGAARTLAADPDLRALVLAGSGGAFCAGGDLKRMLERHRSEAPPGAEDQAARMRALHDWWRVLRDLPVPVIAAVDGPAYGAGLGLACLGDIILASDRATFNASFCKVGAVPDGGLFHSLPRKIGLQRAREMFFTGRTVDAAEAQRIGLAMEVVAPDALLPRALEMAAMMEECSPTAFRLTKELSGRAMELGAEELLTAEAQAQAICMQGQDFRRAYEAFVAKERPVFVGD